MYLIKDVCKQGSTGSQKQPSRDVFRKSCSEKCNFSKAVPGPYYLNNISIIIQGSLLEKQKQPPEVFSKKRCFQKCHKIHRKTPVPGTVFSSEFCEISKNTFWTPFLQNTSGRLLLEKIHDRVYFRIELHLNLSPIFSWQRGATYIVGVTQPNGRLRSKR